MQALRICCGAFTMTPIPTLLIEMEEFPLRLRRDKLIRNYWTTLCGVGLGSVSECLLVSSCEFSDNMRKANFLHHIKWVAGELELECESVAAAGWPPVPPWLLPEPEAGMSCLEEERNSLRADVERALEQVGVCLNIVAAGVGIKWGGATPPLSIPHTHSFPLSTSLSPPIYPSLSPLMVSMSPRIL